MKLIALRGFPFGRLNLRTGQVFEASGRDARLLIAVNRARRYDEAVAPVAPDEAEAMADDPIVAAGPKRKYKRRDMSAE